MRIRLAELIGPRCITMEQGTRLYEEVRGPLARGEEVIVDLEGVRTLISLFLNNSLGPLFKEYERERLSSLVHFENASATQLETIERVMANAEEYYRNPERRKAVDEALARQVEEED